MIRIRKLLISVLAIMVLTSSCAGLAEARARSVIKNKKHLPAIELKDFELKGTVISGILDPIAIIEHTTAKENYWYKIGDEFCGGHIVDIQRGAIVLEIKNIRYLFGLPEGALNDENKVTFSSGTDKQEEYEKIAIGEKAGDNVWNIKLNAAISMLTKVSKIMKDVRIKPYFAIGKAAGIRIDRIKGRSVIKDIGLEDGDIIKGVNGFGVMAPTKIFEAYRKYRDDRLIQLQLIRNEEPVTLTYNIVK